MLLNLLLRRSGFLRGKNGVVVLVTAYSIIPRNLAGEGWITMTQLKQIVYVPRENGGYFILAINDGGILFRGTPKNARAVSS